MWFKGIVMEVKDEYSIVMKDNSEIVRVKNKDGMKKGDINIFIDEDIYNKKESKNNKNKMIISILTIAAVLSLVILPMLQNNLIKSYALVSLDINPSIQFELDDNKKIVYIYGLNEDGNKLKLDDVKGLTLDEGMKKLKTDLQNNNYNLKNDSMIVGFTFLTNNEDNNYENDVKSIIGKEFKGTKTAFFKGTKEGSEIAKDKGMSLGRYEAKLSMDEDIMEEQIEDMSVEEILSLLKGKNNIYLNEDMKDELKDELEDKLEDRNEDNNEDNNEDDGEDEDYEDSDKEENDDKDDDR